MSQSIELLNQPLTIIIGHNKWSDIPEFEWVIHWVRQEIVATLTQGNVCDSISVTIQSKFNRILFNIQSLDTVIQSTKEDVVIALTECNRCDLIVYSIGIDSFLGSLIPDLHSEIITSTHNEFWSSLDYINGIHSSLMSFQLPNSFHLECIPNDCMLVCWRCDESGWIIFSTPTEI